VPFLKIEVQFELLIKEWIYLKCKVNVKSLYLTKRHAMKPFLGRGYIASRFLISILDNETQLCTKTGYSIENEYLSKLASDKQYRKRNVPQADVQNLLTITFSFINFVTKNAPNIWNMECWGSL
jgi:hypothetical protein